MSNEINVNVKCNFDEDNLENLKRKLKSYELGKEFNYAVVVLKILIGDKAKQVLNEINVNIVSKVQYIAPFVSKKLAEEYREELSLLNKITMFLPIDENGRVVVKNYSIEETISNTKNKIMEPDENLPAEKYFFLFACAWKNNNEEEKEKILQKFGLRYKNEVKKLLNDIVAFYHLN